MMMITTSQMMTCCTLPKTEPVGDAFQSTVLQPADDDDDDDDYKMKLKLLPHVTGSN